MIWNHVWFILRNLCHRHWKYPKFVHWTSINNSSNNNSNKMVKLSSCSLVGFSIQKRLFESLLLVLSNNKKFTRCPANYGHETNWPTADMDTCFYQITMIHVCNILHFTCQLYLKKAGKNPIQQKEPNYWST